MIRWLTLLVMAVLGVSAPWGQAFAEPLPPLRIGLTTVVPGEQYGINIAMEQFLSRAMKRPVTIELRDTYREIVNLIGQGRLDIAWLCGLPYTRNSDWLQLLAVPVNGVEDGTPTYRSLIITANNEVHQIDDLQGRVFAFADPDSNSGHLVPEWLLLRRGSDPERFFRAFFFTNSHRDVVRAVHDGLADGGSVDSYVLELLRILEPDMLQNIRVIASNGPYGFPPLVVRRDIPPELFRQLQKSFTNADQSPEGRAFLEKTKLQGFIAGSDVLFREIRAMDSQVFPLLRTVPPFLP